MNLIMAPVGVNLVIEKIKEKDNQSRYLNNLGFVEGATIVVISQLNGDLIVKVKESRIAIGKDLAKKVIISV